MFRGSPWPSGERHWQLLPLSLRQRGGPPPPGAPPAGQAGSCQWQLGGFLALSFGAHQRKPWAGAGRRNTRNTWQSL